MKEEKKWRTIGKNRVVAEWNEVTCKNVKIFPNLTKKKEKEKTRTSYQKEPPQKPKTKTGDRSGRNDVEMNGDGKFEGKKF